MQRIKSAITKAYISTLHFSHIQSNFIIFAFDDPYIDLIIRGDKRVYEEEEYHIRLSLIVDILECIIREINNDSNGFNIKVVLCMAFAGFLRAEEFT